MSVFDGFVTIALWSAACVFALSLGMMVLLLVLRTVAVARRRHLATLAAFWRARFAGAGGRLARVSARDAFSVLNFWNDAVRAAAANGDAPLDAGPLFAVAVSQDFAGLALTLLRRKDAGDRLAGLTTLGTLRVRAALPAIDASLDDVYGQVSLAAWRAAVRIEPVRLPAFALAIARHTDWQAREVEEVLREIGPEPISAPIAASIESASDAEVLRVMRYLILCEPETARTILRRVLAAREDPEVLASALRTFASSMLAQDRDVVRPFLAHPIPFVRIAAIGAFIPVCVAEDRATMLALLTDGNSWVRYRAAQAALDCFSAPGDESDLRSEVVDPYGRDAITQVLAERSAASLRGFLRDEIPPPRRSSAPRRKANDLRVEA